MTNGLIAEIEVPPPGVDVFSQSYHRHVFGKAFLKANELGVEGKRIVHVEIVRGGKGPDSHTIYFYGHAYVDELKAKADKLAQEREEVLARITELTKESGGLAP